MALAAEDKIRHSIKLFKLKNDRIIHKETRSWACKQLFSTSTLSAADISQAEALGIDVKGMMATAGGQVRRPKAALERAGQRRADPGWRHHNAATVYTENSDSGVLMVQSAKDRLRYDVSRVLNWA